MQPTKEERRWLKGRKNISKEGFRGRKEKVREPSGSKKFKKPTSEKSLRREASRREKPVPLRGELEQKKSGGGKEKIPGKGNPGSSDGNR